MTRIGWLIDTTAPRLGEAADGRASLAEAARAAGHAVIEGPLAEIADRPQAILAGLPVVVRAPVQTLRRLRFSAIADSPGGLVLMTYGSSPNFSYPGTAAHYGRHMLNDDFVVLPFGEIERRGLEGGPGFFLRPNTDAKAFSGLPIPAVDWDHELSSLRQLHNPDPADLIVRASLKGLPAEYRFVIADGVVVTGSCYMVDGVAAPSRGVDGDCLKLARTIAQEPWQPCTIYICDIALTRQGPRLLELNAFSCSGLYACDTEAIIQAVAQAVWKELTGE